MIITKTAGFYIINGSPVALSPGQVVSYRDDAEVDEFDTGDAMWAEYERRLPATLAAFVVTPGPETPSEIFA